MEETCGWNRTGAGGNVIEEKAFVAVQMTENPSEENHTPWLKTTGRDGAGQVKEHATGALAQVSI